MGTPRIDKFEKNYFINGGMDFFQRSGATSVSIPNVGGGNFISADRWSLRYQGSWNTTPLSQRGGTTPNTQDKKITYNCGFFGDAADSTASVSFFQPIESVFARELANKKISISGWILSNSALDVRLIIETPDVTDNYASVTEIYNVIQSNILTIGEWTQFKFENIDIPEAAISGIRVALLFTNMSVTGSTEVHNVTGLMLNQGETALDFERAGRNYNEELLMCQRYYEKSYRLDVPPGAIDVQGAFRFRGPNLTTTQFQHTSFNTPKRVESPTLIIYSPDTGAAGFMRNEQDGTDHAGGQSGLSNFRFTTRSTGTIAGNNRLMSFHWTADAEL